MTVDFDALDREWMAEDIQTIKADLAEIKTQLSRELDD